MSGSLTWYCQLFGYASCGAMSTFEALVLFSTMAFLAWVVLVLFLGLIAALNER